MEQEERIKPHRGYSSLIIHNYRGLASSGGQSSSSGSGSSGHSGSLEHHDHMAILFPFVAVAIGCAITYGQRRYKTLAKVPYTVWLFVIGIVAGSINYEMGSRWDYEVSSQTTSIGSLSESMNMWMRIDPHVLLYSFLPLLLFGDSMMVNFHDFHICYKQCLFMAIPGVLAGTSMMYLFTIYVFPYNWNSSQAAAFASILAATDPVAVVALLNELGASRTLTMQIAGESLLNDGTAMVVWTMFTNMMLGEEYAPLDVVWLIVRLAGGGVLFGLAVGWVTTRGLAMASDKLVESDHLVQVSLTIVAAYLAFFCGENDLGVSGVLSTIVAALVLSRNAKPLYCHPESMAHVWHTAEFFANTVLFMLCGLVFYESCLEVLWEDLAWCVLLYVTAVAARGIMLFVSFPFLNLVAKTKPAEVTWKEAVIMTWGGLRGAVGLALAISMRSALYQVGDKRSGDLIVFHVAGFAGLTLCVNATTCGVLIEVLGLTKPAMSRVVLLKALRKDLHSMATELAKNFIGDDRRFQAVRMEDVEEELDKQAHYAEIHCQFDASRTTIFSAIHGAQHASSAWGVGAFLQGAVGQVKDGVTGGVQALQMSKLKEHLGLGDSRSFKQVGEVVCKYCKAEMDGFHEFCPKCGKAVHGEDSRTPTTFMKDDLADAALASEKLGVGVASGDDAAGGTRKPEGQAIGKSDQKAQVTLNDQPDFRRPQSDFRRSEMVMGKSETPDVGNHWWWGFQPIKHRELAQDLGEIQNATKEAVAGPRCTRDPLHADDLTSERNCYLSMLRASYLSMLREDMIPSNAKGALELVSSVDRAADFTHMELRDWAELMARMEESSVQQSKLARMISPLPWRMYAPQLTLDRSRIFDLFTLVVFLDAHHALCAQMCHNEGMMSLARVSVIVEAGRQVEETRTYLQKNKVGSEQIGLVRTKQLLAMIFGKQIKQVAAWTERAIINNSEAEELIAPIHHSMKLVRRYTRGTDGVGSNTVSATSTLAAMGGTTKNRKEKEAGSAKKKKAGGEEKAKTKNKKTDAKDRVKILDTE